VVKKILVGVAVALLILAAVIGFQPARFRVTRSVTIAAAPADAFAQVSDFHNWDAWSPWAKLDPAMKTTYDGPASGTGAVYRWTGDRKVGEGSMTILESVPATRVRIRLEFIKPFASVADTAFDFAPAGSGTTVTWTMSGESGFVSKAFCLFTGGMDKLIGPDFEKGLAQMKTVVEKKAPPAPAGS
jgi:hypothetical protein